VSVWDLLGSWLEGTIGYALGGPLGKARRLLLVRAAGGKSDRELEEGALRVLCFV